MLQIFLKRSHESFTDFLHPLVPYLLSESLSNGTLSLQFYTINTQGESISMAQTVKGQQEPPQKQYRPGQRQQERMQRQERRKRRQRIWGASIAASVLIILSVVGILEYQRYNADRAAAQLASTNATATKVATIHAKATATQLAFANATATYLANIQATATAKCLVGLHSTPTPTAGPANPPVLSGTTVKLPDGLQYIDVQIGCGPAAQSGSSVSVQYTGWLQKTGKKFDSSWDHKAQAFTLALGQGKVIKGFDEGLIGMKQGGSRRIIIPAALGYGTAGSPPTIPPNSVLIFDVTMGSVTN
jgi:FKBP-type peptidyl-prolyl cis-trans isomerase